MIQPAHEEDLQTEGLASQGKPHSPLPPRQDLSGPLWGAPIWGITPKCELAGTLARKSYGWLASTRRWHGPLGSQWIQEGRTSSQSPCRPVCLGRRGTTPSSPSSPGSSQPPRKKTALLKSSNWLQSWQDQPCTCQMSIRRRKPESLQRKRRTSRHWPIFAWPVPMLGSLHPSEKGQGSRRTGC